MCVSVMLNFTSRSGSILSFRGKFASSFSNVNCVGMCMMCCLFCCILVMFFFNF